MSVISLPVDPQNGKVLVEVIADEKVAPVRRECRAFRQTAHFDLLDLRDFLAVNPQHRKKAIAVIVPGGLIVRTRQDDCHRDVSLRADGQAFRPVADHHAIGDARRFRLEINDADGIDAAVGGAGIAVVRRQRDVTVRSDRDVVGPKASGQIELRRGHLVAR